MNFVFTNDGFRRLVITWFILGASIVAAVAIGWGSHVYLQGEKRDGVSSRRQLAEAQARVDAAKRESEDLKASAEIFEDLVKRGILQEENRLDFIERLGRLKARHQLFALDYEIAPQRALPLAGGRAFNTVDVLGSRITLRAQALHEGDALAFLRGARHAPARVHDPEPLRAAQDGGRVRGCRRAAGRGAVRPGVDHPQGQAGSPCELASRSILLAASTAVPAQQLGTLFHSPKEREALERLRRGELPTQPGQVGAPLPDPVLTGFVKRSDGKSTVFIDKRPYPARDPRVQGVLEPRIVERFEPIPLPPAARRQPAPAKDADERPHAAGERRRPRKGPPAPPKGGKSD